MENYEQDIPPSWLIVICYGKCRLTNKSTRVVTRTDYRRTPLPKQAESPVSWIALCFMSLIFSPFLGFAVEGVVAAPGLVNAFYIAVIALFGLSFIAIRHWYAWRNLPPNIVEEYKKGKIILAEGAPAIVPPVKFTQDKDWIELLPNGIACANHTLLRLQGVSEFTAKVWAVQQGEQLFIPWSDIVEWAVQTDSDNPDYYSLVLQPSGYASLRRFKPSQACECDILDAVRSIGKVPVRLFCDVECE